VEGKRKGIKEEDMRKRRGKLVRDRIRMIKKGICDIKEIRIETR